MDAYKSTKPEYDIIVSANKNSYTWRIADLQPIAEIDGVIEVAPNLANGDNYVLLLDDRGMYTYNYTSKEYKGFYTYPYAADDSIPCTTEEDGEIVYHVVLDGTYCDDTFKKDKIIYIRIFGHYVIKARISQILTEEEAAQYEERYVPEEEREKKRTRNSVRLYFRPDDYMEIFSQMEVYGYSLKLDEQTSSVQVIEQLYSHYRADELMLVMNRSADYEVGYNRLIGMNLLYTTLSALLCVFFAVITTLTLLEYVQTQRTDLRLLHLQGASHRHIVAAFVRILAPLGILCCAAVWAISGQLERAYYRLIQVEQGYTDATIKSMTSHVDDYPLYIGAALIVVAVFVLPAVLNVIKTLREFNRE